MAGRQFRVKSVVERQVKEIYQDHLQCIHLVKARFRTVFMISLMFLLCEIARTTMAVCFLYRGPVQSLGIPRKLQAWLIYFVPVMANIPAGRLSELYGAKWFIFASVAGCGLFMGLIPVTSDSDDGTLRIFGEIWYYAILFFTGNIMPSGQVILARWSIPSEKILMSAIVYSATPLGMGVGVMMSVWLCSSFGYKVPFYVVSAICLCVAVLWGIFISDSYESPKSIISNHEKEYMEREMVGQLYDYKNKRFSRLPLKEILKCRSMWSVFVVQLTFVVCHAIFMTSVSERVRRRAANGIPPIANAVIIAQPYFCSAMLCWVLGMVFFNLESEQILTARGAYQTASAITIVGIIITSLLDRLVEEDIVHLFYEEVLMGSLSGIGSTCSANYLHMTPNYAGTVKGIHNTVVAIILFLVFAILPGFHICTTAPTVLLAASMVLTLCYYQVYVTGDLMPYNDYPLARGHIEHP